MHIHEFWHMLDECVAQSPNSIDERIGVLRRSLSRRVPAEIPQWFRALEQALALAATPVTRAVADLAGYDDDGFIDFRAWLIIQGKVKHDWWISRADQLADVGDPQDWRTSKLIYVAQDAYEAATGTEAPFFYPDDLYREMSHFSTLDEAQVRERLPKLWQRFRGE